MNHFGKYFSFKVFYRTFAISSLLAILINFYIFPQKERIPEYEHQNNIHLDTDNTVKKNFNQIAYQPDYFSIIKYQELANNRTPDIEFKTIELVKEQNDIMLDTNAEEAQQSNSENIQMRPNKLYYINDCDFIYELNPEYQNYLWKMCEKYEVVEYYELFLAQMYHESGFDANAISSTNDYGLMQINICNHEWLSRELGSNNFLDPYTSIEAGVYIMSMLLKKYNNVQTALVCYNMGESAIQRNIYSTKYSKSVLEDRQLLVELEN